MACSFLSRLKIDRRHSGVRGTDDHVDSSASPLLLSWPAAARPYHSPWERVVWAGARPRPSALPNELSNTPDERALIRDLVSVLGLPHQHERGVAL